MKKVAARRRSRLGGGLATQRRGQLGINVVERIVLQDWSSRWQPLDAHNDDGVDGLIFIEAGGSTTGQVIYVQVKCTSRLKPSGDVGIPIGRARLKKAIRRWRRLIGAAILIHVDPETLEARWVDLHVDDDIRKATIHVPGSQLFNAAAKGAIGDLCGTLHRDLTARKVQTSSDDFPHLRSKKHIQVAARELYRELALAPVSMGNTEGRVTFTREGWRHITRRGRPELTRFQSLVLLGTVRPILAKMTNGDIQVLPTPHEPEGEEYFVVKAAVSFPHRQSGIVKMVLHRNANNSPNIYRFHTIYEPRRRRSLNGVRKSLAQ